MKKKTWISTVLAISAVMGTALALPNTASAREVITEKRVKVIRTIEHDGARRHGDVDRRYLERHRKVSRRFAEPRYPRHRGRGHKFGHYKHHHKHHGKHRHEHRRYYDDYREVRRYEPRYEHRRHDDSGVRVRIDYDFVL